MRRRPPCPRRPAASMWPPDEDVRADERRGQRQGPATNASQRTPRGNAASRAHLGQRATWPGRGSSEQTICGPGSLPRPEGGELDLWNPGLSRRPVVECRPPLSGGSVVVNWSEGEQGQVDARQSLECLLGEICLNNDLNPGLDVLQH